MATADDYAQWIVTNADKKGTPEFNTVAAAYKEAKGDTTPAVSTGPKLDTNTARNIIGSVYEPLAKFATGMIAQPVSDVMGLAATAQEALSPSGASPEQFRNDIREAMTYEPTTVAGASKYNPLNAIPAGIGAAFEALSPNQAEDGSTLGGMAQNAVRGLIPYIPIVGPAGMMAAAGPVSKMGGRGPQIAAALEKTAPYLDPLYAAQKLPGAIGSIIPKSPEIPMNDVSRETLKNAQAAGYTIPRSLYAPSFGTNRLESMGGKAATKQQATLQNVELTNNLARKALDLPPDAPLTPETTNAVAKKAYEEGYLPLNGIGKVPTDAKYLQDLNDIVSKYKGAEKSFPGAVASDVENVIFGKGESAQPAKTIYSDAYGNIVDKSLVPQAPKLRNLLDELKKSGGISTNELADLGVENVHTNYPGLTRKAGGKDMDSVVEWMQQNNWLSAEDVAMAERSGVGGSHELARDMVRAALDREPVIHPEDGAAYYDYQSALQQLDEAGIKPVKIPEVPSTRAGGVAVPEFNSADAVNMIQVLRENAKKAFSANDAPLGKANRAAATALENQIERHLENQGGAAGNLLQNFRAAREKIAKANTVEESIRVGAGNADPQYYAGRLQAGKPLTGPLRTIGETANTFPQVMKSGEKTMVPGVSKSEALAMLMSGMLGGAITGDVLGMSAAALPLLSGPARALALSPKLQKSLSGSAAVKPSFMNDTRARQARLAALLAAQQEQAQ